MEGGGVIKYHIFISVVVIELSVRCLNTGSEKTGYTLTKSVVIEMRAFTRTCIKTTDKIETAFSEFKPSLSLTVKL